MKEYIKMGFGFSLGVLLSMAAIKAVNKLVGAEVKNKPDESKSGENVTTEEVA